jgi:hypothetical protein
MIRPYFSRAFPVDDDDARAVSFLRTHMGPSELAYRTAEKSEPYAIWAVFQPRLRSIQTIAGATTPTGSEKLSSWRGDVLATSDDWFDRLSAQNVAWIVTDPDDIAIGAILDRPKGRQRASLAAQYGNVRIFHLD